MSVTGLKFNKLITDKAIGYLQDTQDFVATRAFPVISTLDEYGSYPQYDTATLLKTTLGKVAPGTSFNKSEAEVEWKTIELYKHGVDRPIPDEKKKRLQNAKQDAANQLTVEGYRYLEKLTNTTVLASTSFNVAKTGGSDFTKFSDYTNSTPIETIRALVKAQTRIVGLPMDSILFADDVYEAIINHPDIIGRIGDNMDLKVINDQLLARLFGVKNIFVSQAVENTANTGGTANTSLQITDKFLIYHRGLDMLDTPGAAKILYCNDPIYGGNLLNINEGRDEDAEADIIRIKGHFMPVVTAKDLGVICSDAI